MLQHQSPIANTPIVQSKSTEGGDQTQEREQRSKDYGRTYALRQDNSSKNIYNHVKHARNINQYVQSTYKSQKLIAKKKKRNEKNCSYTSLKK